MINVTFGYNHQLWQWNIINLAHNS